MLCNLFLAFSPFLYFFFLSFCLGAFSSLFPFFLSLSSTVCLFEEVVKYRIFEEIGEESEDFV